MCPPVSFLPFELFSLSFVIFSFSQLAIQRHLAGIVYIRYHSNRVSPRRSANDRYFSFDSSFLFNLYATNLLFFKFILNNFVLNS